MQLKEEKCQMRRRMHNHMIQENNILYPSTVLSSSRGAVPVPTVGIIMHYVKNNYCTSRGPSLVRKGRCDSPHAWREKCTTASMTLAKLWRLLMVMIMMRLVFRLSIRTIHVCISRRKFRGRDFAYQRFLGVFTLPVPEICPFELRARLRILLRIRSSSPKLSWAKGGSHDTGHLYLYFFPNLFFSLSFSCTVILQAFLFVSPVNSYREHYWLATKLEERRRRKIHVGWTRIVAGQKSDKRKKRAREKRDGMVLYASTA